MVDLRTSITREPKDARDIWKRSQFSIQSLLLCIELKFSLRNVSSRQCAIEFFDLNVLIKGRSCIDSQQRGGVDAVQLWTSPTPVSACPAEVLSRMAIACPCCRWRAAPRDGTSLLPVAAARRRIHRTRDIRADGAPAQRASLAAIAASLDHACFVGKGSGSPSPTARRYHAPPDPKPKLAPIRGKITLYIAALTASRRMRAFKATNDRMRERKKPPKAILIAVARRLMNILNAMARDAAALKA